MNLLILLFTSNVYSSRFDIKNTKNLADYLFDQTDILYKKLSRRYPLLGAYFSYSYCFNDYSSLKRGHNLDRAVEDLEMHLEMSTNSLSNNYYNKNAYIFSSDLLNLLVSKVCDSVKPCNYLLNLKKIVGTNFNQMNIMKVFEMHAIKRIESLGFNDDFLKSTIEVFGFLEEIGFFFDKYRQGFETNNKKIISAYENELKISAAKIESKFEYLENGIMNKIISSHNDYSVDLSILFSILESLHDFKELLLNSPRIFQNKKCTLKEYLMYKSDKYALIKILNAENISFEKTNITRYYHSLVEKKGELPVQTFLGRFLKRMILMKN